LTLCYLTKPTKFRRRRKRRRRRRNDESLDQRTPWSITDDTFKKNKNIEVRFTIRKPQFKAEISALVTNDSVYFTETAMHLFAYN